MKLMLSPLTYVTLTMSLAFAMTGCLRPPTSDTKILNGEDGAGKFATTVKLTIIKKGNIKETCAGAFIQDNLLLTSGSCLEDATEVKVESDAEPFKSRPVTSKKFERHEKYTSSTAESTKNNKTVTFKYVPNDAIPYDIGLVVFPAGTAPETAIARLAVAAPAVGDAVFLAGFGASDTQGTVIGTRRWGKNKIATIGDNVHKVISIKGATDTEGATMGSGDSGGPLYNTVDPSQIIGVTSSKFLSHDVGYYVNVQSESANAFLKKYLRAQEAPKTGTQTVSSKEEASKACTNGTLTVGFKDNGTARSLAISDCNAKFSCSDSSLLATGSSSSASVMTSSAAACSKVLASINAIKS